MKVLVKKIYCPSCQILVSAREQKLNGNTGFLCSRCNRLLRLWDGMVWKYPREKS
jgi:transposase-like protein